MFCETVILLSRKAPDAEIKVRLDMSELDITSAESKVIYKEIQEYVIYYFFLRNNNQTRCLSIGNPMTNGSYHLFLPALDHALLLNK